jgi:hypothetical protein
VENHVRTSRHRSDIQSFRGIAVELGHASAGRGSIADGVNYLLYQGKSFVFKGVKIEFLESGFDDKI